MPYQIFSNNVTVAIILPGAEQPEVGYVFASAGSPPGTQEQRWVLYLDTPIEAGTRLRLQPASEPHAYTNLGDFQAALLSSEPSGLWREGATYIEVVASVWDDFAEGGPAPLVVGPALRAKASGAHEPHGPRRSADRHAPHRVGRGAGDYMGPREIINAFPIFQFHDRVYLTRSDSEIGQAFGTDLDPLTGPQGSFGTNREFWVLKEDYAPPGTEPNYTTLEVVHEDEMTVEAFLEDTHKKWKSGSTVIIADCAYFHGPQSL